MRILAAAFCATLALAAQAADKPPTLVQNEYVFVRATAKLGIRDGFLQYLDRQAITFAPRPVNAYDLYSGRKPSSTKLDWYPTFALVSASGDFGVDTGPWVATWVKDGKDQRAYGEWLSVWHRDAQGQWHALFDAGVGHDGPNKTAALPEAGRVDQLPPVRGWQPTTGDVQDEIARAEVLFSNTVQVRSPLAAYSAYATAGLRFLQDGKLPIVGLVGVTRAVSDKPASVQYLPMGGSTAPSGDLGYIYGMTYKSDDADHKNPLATYMHVWMHDAGGWKLVIAEEQPLPPPGK